MLSHVSICHEWQHLYKEVMIKGGSHAKNNWACETQNQIGHLTRHFLGSDAQDYILHKKCTVNVSSSH